MKIKVVIAEKDKIYTTKLINNLVGKYTEQLEIYSFTESALLEQFLKEEEPDIVLAAEEFKGAAQIVGRKTIFAYLTNYKTEEVEGVTAVCKYQKVENIYKQILNLYSELGKNYVNRQENRGGMQIVSFFGISGGAGASTMAAAFAVHQAAKGKKVLYLNLEKLASTAAFFHQEGTAAFDEVLFALKSKKISLGLKIESSVRRDLTGVYFFEACGNCIDILELTEEDIQNLLEGISSMNQYDYLVVDSDFTMDGKMNLICEYSSKIVLVSTGSAVNNLKMEKYIKSLHNIEERSKISIQSKLCIVYNKFRNKESNAMNAAEVKNIGGVPMLENGTAIETVRYIAGLDFWETIEE